MINEELTAIANTPKLEQLAYNLDTISTLLHYNFQELIKLENTYHLTIDEQIVKAKLIDTIGKLILKL